MKINFINKKPMLLSPDGTEGGGNDFDYEQLANLFGEPEQEEDSEEEETAEGEEEETQEETEEPGQTEQTDAIDLEDIGKLSRSEIIQRIKDLEQGNLRQSDYTKKTQEISSLRKEFDAEKPHFDKYKDFVQFLNQNPSVADKVRQAMSEQNPNEAQKYVPMYDPNLDPAVQEVRALAEEVRQSQERTRLDQARQAVEQDWSNLVSTSKFNEADKFKEQVFKLAVEEQIPLKYAFKEIMGPLIDKHNETERMKMQTRKPATKPLTKNVGTGSKQPSANPRNLDEALSAMFGEGSSIFTSD